MFLYSTSENEVEKKFRKMASVSVLWSERTICRNVGSLSQNLIRSVVDSRIAVLLISNREELLTLMSIRDLLLEVRIILVLPDRGEDTARIGHRLYPRFVSYMDSDFGEIAAILDKMAAGVMAAKGGNRNEPYL